MDAENKAEEEESWPAEDEEDEEDDEEDEEDEEDEDAAEGEEEGESARAGAEGQGRDGEEAEAVIRGPGEEKIRACLRRSGRARVRAAADGRKRRSRRRRRAHSWGSAGRTSTCTAENHATIQVPVHAPDASPRRAPPSALSLPNSSSRHVCRTRRIPAFPAKAPASLSSPPSACGTRRRRPPRPAAAAPAPAEAIRRALASSAIAFAPSSPPAGSRAPPFPALRRHQRAHRARPAPRLRRVPPAVPARPRRSSFGSGGPSCCSSSATAASAATWRVPRAPLFVLGGILVAAAARGGRHSQLLRAARFFDGARGRVRLFPTALLRPFARVRADPLLRLAVRSDAVFGLGLGLPRLGDFFVVRRYGFSPILASPSLFASSSSPSPSPSPSSSSPSSSPSSSSPSSSSSLTSSSSSSSSSSFLHRDLLLLFDLLPHNRLRRRRRQRRRQRGRRQRPVRATARDQRGVAMSSKSSKASRVSSHGRQHLRDGGSGGCRRWARARPRAGARLRPRAGCRAARPAR